MVRVNMVSVPDYGFWYQHATATLLFSFYGGLETARLFSVDHVFSGHFVPYHRGSANTRNGARLQSPSPFMAHRKHINNGNRTA